MGDEPPLVLARSILAGCRDVPDISRQCFIFALCPPHSSAKTLNPRGIRTKNPLRYPTISSR